MALVNKMLPIYIYICILVIIHGDQGHQEFCLHVLNG